MTEAFDKWFDGLISDSADSSTVSKYVQATSTDFLNHGKSFCV